MRNYNSKFKNFFHEKDVTEKFTEIYSFREGANSAGSFGFERARKTNPTVIPKIF
jgi:hypothetical protein